MPFLYIYVYSIIKTTTPTTELWAKYRKYDLLPAIKPGLFYFCMLVPVTAEEDHLFTIDRPLIFSLFLQLLLR